MSLRLRTCVGCRRRRSPDEMLRLCRRRDGVPVLVSFRRVQGRSVYLCPRADCYDRALRRRGIERGLGRRGRVLMEPTSLWSSLTVALEHELNVLRRTGAVFSRRSALEGVFAATLEAAPKGGG